MKPYHLLSILSIILLTACTSQKNVNQFYNKYQGSENSISMKTPLFLGSLLANNSEDLKAIRDKVKSVQILSLDELNEIEGQQISQELNSALQKDGFDSWFNMNKNGRVINVSTQNRGKSLKNIVVAVQGEERVTFISAKTNISEKELSKFINSIMASEED